MKYWFVATLFIALLAECTSAKRAVPSAVGVVPLRNYQINPDFLIVDEVNYQFFGNDDSFYKLFYMIRGTGATAPVPDFKSQSVVAIVLRPTEKVVSVDINKAEILGETLRVFYTVTDTTSYKTYAQVPMVVATVPKNLGVKEVSFFKNNVKKRTIKPLY